MPSTARRLYGLATWIPVTMMGMAYLAAAFAKFDETGIRWITDGVVRYFFVIDAPNAPSGVGRAVASSDVLSVLLAGGAVLTEAFVIVGALYSRTLVVLAAGAGALALHAGFWVFQGVWWPAWWAMLPAFLPWSAVARAIESRFPDRTHSPVAPVSATWRFERRVDTPVAVAVVLGAAVLQQPIVSLARIEYRPLFSDFSMYSDSQWSSKEEFAAFMEREKQPPYAAVRFVGADGADAMLVAARLRDVDPGHAVTDAARAVAAGIEPDAAQYNLMRAVGARYEERFGVPMLPLRVASARWRFDWSIADFTPADAWRTSGVLDDSPSP